MFKRLDNFVGTRRKGGFDWLYTVEKVDGDTSTLINKYGWFFPQRMLCGSEL